MDRIKLYYPQLATVVLVSVSLGSLFGQSSHLPGFMAKMAPQNYLPVALLDNQDDMTGN